MLHMVSYPHRLKSGHITYYLNRTYHVLTTEIAYAIGCWAPLIYRAPHNFRYAITNPTAMPTPSAVFATRSLR